MSKKKFTIFDSTEVKDSVIECMRKRGYRSSEMLWDNLIAYNDVIITELERIKDRTDNDFAKIAYGKVIKQMKDVKVPIVNIDVVSQLKIGPGITSTIKDLISGKLPLIPDVSDEFLFLPVEGKTKFVKITEVISKTKVKLGNIMITKRSDGYWKKEKSRGKDKYQFAKVFIIDEFFRMVCEIMVIGQYGHPEFEDGKPAKWGKRRILTLSALMSKEEFRIYSKEDDSIYIPVREDGVYMNTAKREYMKINVILKTDYDCE